MRALIRAIPDTFTRAVCAATPAEPIDVSRARQQHAAYATALAACGVDVTTLPADDACPDCVFVEDTAVIVGRTAIITQPGAPSRRAETAAIAEALGRELDIVSLASGPDDDATVDGGDCMLVGDALYVGRSARTSTGGIARLQHLLPRVRVVAVDMPPGVLHLKCVCSPLGGDRVLLADESIPASTFSASIVRVPVAETYAANAVAVGGSIVVADQFPRTHDALARAGFVLHPVPWSEVRKADGSLTCQSLLFGG